MPYQRPGNSVYVVNNSGGIYLHGQAVVETVGSGKEVGVAVKQKPAHWSDGLTAQNQIQSLEPYLILRRGVVQVPDGGAGFADGDLVYITSGNALTKTAGSNTKFGRVVEVPADGRGVPTGDVRVNLDERNTF
jgi:predicted RecA/RadA family phage recombinase